MASFSIPDIPPKTELSKGSVDAASGKPIAPHSGSVQFAVNNRASEIIDGKLSVQPDGQAKDAWFTIDGAAQRSFKNSASETVKVNILVPADVAQGDYGFRLLVAAVTDPDNDFAISPSTAFTVPEAGKTGGKTKRKWWLWLLLGLLALAIIAGVVWAIDGDDRQAKPGPTGTPEPSAAMLTVPDLKGKNISELATLAAGFDLVQQAVPATGAAPGTILSQNPEPSARPQPQNALLKVTYDPGVEVPAELIGKTAEQSINILSRAGLHVQETRTACRTSGTDGAIVETTPAPNTKVAKNSGVTVHVAVVGGTIGKRRFDCGVVVHDLQVLQPIIMATPIPMNKHDTIVPMNRGQ